MQAIEIEDVSDCASCTAREIGEADMLTIAKCEVLFDVQCHECGRTFGLLVEEQS